MTVLQASAVVVRRGGRAILDQVDLRVEAGQVLALVGPNGAGKSTLLAVLSGDIAPDSGEIQLDGRALHQWGVADLSRRRATLTQEHVLSFPFPVHDVVAMGRHPWRGRDEEDLDDKIVAESMAATSVHHLAERSVPSLSGGEKARTSYARVLAQDVSILLLDEPTAALDLLHQETALDIARSLARGGAAVVVVLHDLTLAAAYADRICVLDQGRIVSDGDPSTTLTSALLSDVYGLQVDVLPHPITGALMIQPARGAR